MAKCEYLLYNFSDAKALLQKFEFSNSKANKTNQLHHL